jgi:hypothetical protein
VVPSRTRGVRDEVVETSQASTSVKHSEISEKRLVFLFQIIGVQVLVPDVGLGIFFEIGRIGGM